MANSPYFGVSGRVGGARQAVVMLGVKSVGWLAVSRTAALVFSERRQLRTPRLLDPLDHDGSGVLDARTMGGRGR